MTLHHRDAVVWDAVAGKFVTSSSTKGSGSPVGLGVADDSGAAHQLTLFPGQTIRDNVQGRIGKIIAVHAMPTGAPGGEVSPATLASAIFNSGLPAEQTALLITSARYTGRNAAAFLIYSDSADGTIQAATHYGALHAGTAYNTTYAFDTGTGTTVTGIVDGTTITGGTIIADGTSGEILVYSGPPAHGNLILSISGASGSDSQGNFYPQGLSVGAGTISGSTISGSTFDGTDFIINSSGAFFYSGTPAAGNLFLSFTQAAGTDSFGNHYPQGLGIEQPTGNLTGSPVTFQDVAGVVLGKIRTQRFAAGPTTFSELEVIGPGTSEIALQTSTSGIDQGVLANTSGADLLVWNATQLMVASLILGLPGGVQSTLGQDASGYPNMTDNAGWAQQISGSKASLVNTATVTGTGNQSIGFRTVPAGDVETGTCFTIFASGFFSTGASVPTSATFTVFWGGTGGTDIGHLIIPGTLGANISSASWFARVSIDFISTTEAIVTLEVGWHTAGGVANSVVFFVGADTAGLVTSGSNNLTLAFAWGSAPGGQSLTTSVVRLGRVA